MTRETLSVGRAPIAALALLAVATAGAGAQTTADDLRLPSDPRLWRNSAPLTLDSLQGKGIVFYFFDEECPRCAANWPAVQNMSKQYEGKPVLFVAVNSGTDPRQLNRYLSQRRVGWPVINDIDRSLEAAMGVPKLTATGETFAVMYVDGEGAIGSTEGADFATVAEAALKGAAWKVDPQEIPPPLRGAWKAVELGDYAAASRDIARAAKARDDAIKTAGEKLLAAVTDAVTADAKAAQESLTEGNDWQAYKRLDSLCERFGDYDLSLVERAQEKRKELAKSDAVRGELDAAKLLDKAVATASKGTPTARRRAKNYLDQVVEKHPSSEAANRAREILASQAG